MVVIMLVKLQHTYLSITQKSYLSTKADSTYISEKSYLSTKAVSTGISEKSYLSTNYYFTLAYT